jgi:hypothetical protein
MEIAMLLRKNLIAIAVVAATIGGSGAAVAQGTMQQQSACEPDVFRLCGNYIPNVGEIVACLRGNEARLSQPCHQVMFSDHPEHPGYERTARMTSDEIQ